MKDIQYEVGLLKRLSPVGLDRMRRAYQRHLFSQRLNNLLKSSPGFGLLMVSIVLMLNTIGYIAWFQRFEGVTEIIALLWACYLFAFPALMIVRMIKRVYVRPSS